MSGTGRFAAMEEQVVTAASCTWCGRGVGVQCVDYKWFALHAAPHTHAQRWYDYWNATEDERIDVYPAPWLHKVTTA